MKSLTISIVIVSNLCIISGIDEDYFSEDYDENKNCFHEEELNKLRKENPNQCIHTAGDGEKGFYSCQKKLGVKLLNEMCPGNEVLKSGCMSYCSTRGFTTCCVE